MAQATSSSSSPEGGRPARRDDCPICGQPLTRSSGVSGLRVRRCRRCGHRVAEGHPQVTADDYHRQYDDGAYLTALAATRGRQAVDIERAIATALGARGGLVDIGSGRGWFLQQCRDSGWVGLAGWDPSPDARDLLSGLGVIPLASLTQPPPFKVEAVTVLDVLEHLDPWEVTEFVGAILVTHRPSIVVVKVPVPGVLYWAAAVLTRLGVEGPMRQLWQMGTDPPHRSYFSRRSLSTLLAIAGLRVERRWEDPEVEAREIGRRTGRRLPPWVAVATGGAIAIAGRVCRRRDTSVVVARHR